jgi:hypothetical protein
MIRGIAAEGLFLYEIILLCLEIPLTRLHQLHKIGDIPKTKRKAADPLSAFHLRHQNCQPPSLWSKDSVAASGGLVKQVVCLAHRRVFYGYG